MASVSRSRRSAAGIAFIVAGAFLLLAIVLPLVAISLPLLVLLGYIAIAAGLIILALGAVNNTVAKGSLFAAGAGWVVLIIASLTTLPGDVVTLGGVVAAAAGVVAAVVIYVGKEISNRAALVFLVAMILTAVYLLNAVGFFTLGPLNVVVPLLLALSLVGTGVLFRDAQRGRR